MTLNEQSEAIQKALHIAGAQGSWGEFLNEVQA
jgi:hypothetical protein